MHISIVCALVYNVGWNSCRNVLMLRLSNLKDLTTSFQHCWKWLQTEQRLEFILYIIYIYFFSLYSYVPVISITYHGYFISCGSRQPHTIPLILVTVKLFDVQVVHFQPYTMFTNRVGCSLCLQQCDTQSVVWIHPTDPPKPFEWQSSAKVELLKVSY
jgi:hypothetical protein